MRHAQPDGQPDRGREAGEGDKPNGRASVSPINSTPEWPERRRSNYVSCLSRPILKEVTVDLDGICRMLLLIALITGSGDRQTEQAQPTNQPLNYPSNANQTKPNQTKQHLSLEPASRHIQVYSGCVNAFGSNAVRAFD